MEGESGRDRSEDLPPSCLLVLAGPLSSVSQPSVRIRRVTPRGSCCQTASKQAKDELSDGAEMKRRNKGGTKRRARIRQEGNNRVQR